jgi:hypothetical protein
MIEWRWGLEPMTMRDRYAKNFAEALDFNTRRDAIKLPTYDPPPARACTTGDGWLELPMSDKGQVRVICGDSRTPMQRHLNGAGGRA